MDKQIAEVTPQQAVYNYQSLLDNKIVRSFLSSMSTYCKSDRGNRLEVALEVFVGVRKDACPLCRLTAIMLEPFFWLTSKSFGSSSKQMKEQFRDPYWRKGLSNVIKGISMFGARKPHVPGAPFQVVWNVTKGCNLKCLHCYANAGTIGIDELTTEEALKAIDVLVDAGVLVIAFSGGEPTIRPDILQLMGHAHQRGIYIAMATNATLFSSREIVRRFKEHGLEFVQISLDGATPKTHDSFRGVPGSFYKAIEGIKNCVAEGLFVVIASTVTKNNLQEVPMLLDLAEGLKANWFMMYNFVPTGRGVEIIDEDLTPEEREGVLLELCHQTKTRKINLLSTAPQFAKIAQEAYSANTSVNDSGCQEAFVVTHFFTTPIPPEMEKMIDFIGGCGAGRFYISLEPNGDIYPCTFFPRIDKVKLGNILTVDFEDMWRNSKLLWKLRNKDILKGECSSCKYRYSCGGCRARAYAYFNDVLAPDPGCTLNRTYFDKALNEAFLTETYETKKTH